MPAAHDPYAALRHRDYCCLLAGNVLAALSVEMQAVAVGWDLYHRTGSAADLGFVGLAQFLPVLLLALPAGQAADHFNRKYLVLIAYSTMMLTSLGLFLFSYAYFDVEWIYLLLILIGVARAIGMPSRSSLVPLIVPLETIGNAVAWNSTGWQIANVAGPALGGLVLAVTDETPAMAYWLAACGLSVSILLIMTMRPRPQEPNIEKRDLQSLIAGLRFVWNTELLLAAITLDLFAVLLGGATALLPIFANDILQAGPMGLGWLRAAPAMGAFVTAMLLTHRPPLKRPGRALLWSVVGFGVATILFGLSENFYLSLFMLILTGAFDNVSVVVRHTLMQLLTPDTMRGRVAAVNAVFISSSNELGAFESGITAHWFGPVASVVGGGIGTILVVIASALYWPSLRRLEPLNTLREQSPEEPPPSEAIKPVESAIKEGPS
jgi:MFS family permease